MFCPFAHFKFSVVNNALCSKRHPCGLAYECKGTIITDSVYLYSSHIQWQWDLGNAVQPIQSGRNIQEPAVGRDVSVDRQTEWTSCIHRNRADQGELTFRRQFECG